MDFTDCLGRFSNDFIQQRTEGLQKFLNRHVLFDTVVQRTVAVLTLLPQ